METSPAMGNPTRRDSPPTDREILEGITEVARCHLGWTGEIRREWSLVEDLALDSMKLLTLAVEVENRFRVCLDPERDRELKTVSDLINAVRRQLEEGA